MDYVLSTTVIQDIYIYSPKAKKSIINEASKLYTTILYLMSPLRHRSRYWNALLRSNWQELPYNEKQCICLEDSVWFQLFINAYETPTSCSYTTLPLGIMTLKTSSPYFQITFFTIKATLMIHTVKIWYTTSKKNKQSWQTQMGSKWTHQPSHRSWP